ncbi:MAG: ogr/Delta-like zinc finger family protein [Proteobacteria bacterium]|nr:ogr/Delta-like zinc finger family protein [Pseudomonadota bacterium]
MRTSREVTRITREAYVQCENMDCCHVWKVIIGAITTIVPSLNPNPNVYINVSQKPQKLDERQLSLINQK